jgi:hypothetical protein
VDSHSSASVCSIATKLSQHCQALLLLLLLLLLLF